MSTLPTMSAYLNMGISLYYISEFQRAFEAYSSGLALAKKNQDMSLEGAFLGNIGNVYRYQGKLDEALEYMNKARTIFQRIGAPRELQIVEGLILDIKESPAIK